MSPGPKVLRFLGRLLCGIAGIGCLAVGPVVAYGCIALIVVGGSGERYAIVHTGLPASHRLLSWSEWRDAEDTITPFDGYDVGEIVAYRIGSGQGILTQFTFY